MSRCLPFSPTLTISLATFAALRHCPTARRPYAYLNPRLGSAVATCLQVMRSLLTLPRGTTVAMRFRYDNSAGNPRNPATPPVQVHWGQQSREEMGDLWLQVMAKDPRDRELLDRTFRSKWMAADAVGLEALIRRDPGRAALRDDAGVFVHGNESSGRGRAALRSLAQTEARLSSDPFQLRHRAHGSRATGTGRRAISPRSRVAARNMLSPKTTSARRFCN